MSRKETVVIRSNGQKNSPQKNSLGTFMETSRWLGVEQAELRRKWFQELPRESKQADLFAFEMMLKGLVCLGSPQNYPGAPQRSTPLSARSFNGELRIAHSVLQRLVQTGNRLLVESDRPREYCQYSESILAKDFGRFEQNPQIDELNDPALSLARLISVLENLVVLSEGLLKAPHVSYGEFLAVIKLARRAIHRSVFFNPLAALEFTEAYDRIYPEPIMRLVRKTRNEQVQKVIAIVILSLLRLLAYIDKIDSMRRNKDTELGSLGVWLVVLRCDARALSIFLRRNAPHWIAQGFGSLYESLPPSRVNEEYQVYTDTFKQLRPLGELMVSIGELLRLEQRKAFEQRLTAIRDITDPEQFQEAAGNAMQSLRAFLQNALALIVSEQDPSIEVAKNLPGFMPPEVHSARLRRDIWMFQQILRAFLEKAQTTVDAADTWSGMASFQFVRTFVRYFRSLGYHLLRYSNYDQFNELIYLLDRLKGGDVLQVQRFSNVVEACEDFQDFLNLSFESLNEQDELKDIPFDKKDAAMTLKLFLTN